MVGKSKKKLISSLSQKKYRDKTGFFVAEGPKLVNDLLSAGMRAELIFTTDSNILKHTDSKLLAENINDQELKQISFLKTPQKILAVFKKTEPKFIFGEHSESLTLCLDGIQDPGNMGTILRLADWFAISHVICSRDTTDVFNPKVVQASMGAFARLKVLYTDLSPFCQQSVSDLNMEVFGTFMDGENIYSKPLPRKGLIVLGNEGQGIRPETEKVVTTKLSIPRFDAQADIPAMESLNVGMAAAIVCSEFRRPLFL